MEKEKGREKKGKELRRKEEAGDGYVLKLLHVDSNLVCSLPLCPSPVSL